MKKEMKCLIASISLCLVSILAVCMAVFLPSNTKADNLNRVTQSNSQIAVSAEETGAQSADSSKKGGAIYVTKNSTFTMTGGKVQGHDKEYGGAVFVSEGATFTMNAGEISSNTATYGGAIYVSSGGTCNLVGGTITKNFAEYGAAIYVEEGGIVNVSDDFIIVNNSEILSGIVVNYIVDGLVQATSYVDKVERTFNYADASYSLEETCGFYQDEDMTIPINDGALVVDPYKDVESVASTFSNSSQDGDTVYLDRSGILNIYTATATLSKLNFSLSGDCYYVSGNDSCEGDVVIPAMYKGLPVNLASAAFSNKNIQKVILPALSYITDEVFMGSTLTTINFPNTITGISIRAFASCTNLAEVQIPSSVTNIDMESFYYTGLTEITIPGSVSYIDNCIFYNANAPVSITLEEGVETLGSGAFCSGLQISELNLPSTLKTIEEYAFGNFSSTNTAVRNLVIPEGVTLIEEGAFVDCLALTKITLPALETVDGNIFDGCSNLKEIVLRDGTLSLNIPTQIPSLTTINFPSSLKTITNLNVGWETINIPEGIESLGSTAFSGSTNVTELYLPSTVTSIGDNLLKPLTNLVTLTLPSVETVKAEWFGTTSNVNMSGIPSVSRNYYHKNLKTLTMNNGVKNIADYVFDYHPTLEIVNFPNLLKTIGNLSFEGTKIKSINLVNTSLTSIGISAFRRTNGTLSEFPSTLKTINQRAFQLYQGDLTKDLPSGVTKKTSITVPASVTSIGQQAFEGLRRVEEYVILCENANISSASFTTSPSLKRVFLNGNITSLGDHQFRATSQTDTTTYPNIIDVYCSADYDKWGGSWDTLIRSATFGCSYESYQTLGQDILFVGDLPNEGLYGTLVSYEQVASGEAENFYAEITTTSELEEFVIPYGITTLTGILPAIKKLVCSSSLEYIEENGYRNTEILVLNNSETDFGGGAYDAFDSINGPYGMSFKEIYINDTTTDWSSRFNYVPVLAKGFGYTDWQTQTKNGWSILTRTYGDGSEENPYLLSSVDHYNSMISRFASYQEVVEFSDLEKVEYYGSIAVGFARTSTSAEWVENEYFSNEYYDDGTGIDLSGKKYFKLINDIDFKGIKDIPSGEYASISIDGNGYGFLNVDGNEVLGGAMFENGYDMEFRNLNLTTDKRIYPLVSIIWAGTNTFENVNVLPNENGDYIEVTSSDKNTSMYMQFAYQGIINFIDCKNYADYMSSAPYHGIFVGGYVVRRGAEGTKTYSEVNFENVINCGNIIATGIVGVFFGNASHRPTNFTLTNCVNNGDIRYKAINTENLSHILVPRTTGSNDFDTAPYVGSYTKYDQTVLGEIKQNGRILTLESNINASINIATLNLSAISGNLSTGSYELVVNSRMSFTTRDNPGGADSAGNIPMKFYVDLADVASYSFTDVLLTFIDETTYMGLGYNFEALKQTAEVVTKQTDNGPVNVYIDTVNKFYVFDFDGEQEIYKSATTLYYGQIEYTLIVKDAQGNIIDFAKGSLDRFPND